MFTGIIECMGTVVSLSDEGTNRTFIVESALSHELKVDQSVCHNGACLTVTAVEGNRHTVTAILETLQKTNLGQLRPGHLVNLERSMTAGGRFDGHIVQGHVDQTATCVLAEDVQGSWKYAFQYDPSLGNLTVPKGSICVNGVSLTVVDSAPDFFSVAIIPYTFEHTTFRYMKSGDVVNLEFDILGKYLQRMLAAWKPHL